MSDTRKARVLLVDDEEEFVSTLSERLKARNLEVSAATRGEDAIDLVARLDFDVVILDLAMPGMDGLVTLERIKAHHPEIEIIMLTGHGSVKAGIQAMKLGADDFLEKPVDMKTLLSKIGAAHDKHITVLQEKSQDEIDRILKSRGW
ncbi:MAG: response regulator [Desulfofustis sp.]|nr:response regulator [Desulfofustis sp.]